MMVCDIYQRLCSIFLLVAGFHGNLVKSTVLLQDVQIGYPNHVISGMTHAKQRMEICIFSNFSIFMCNVDFVSFLLETKSVISVGLLLRNSVNCHRRQRFLILMFFD